MAIIDYNKYNLHLFDGAAGGSGASSGGDGGTASAGGAGLNTQEGDSKTSNVYTPRSKRPGAYDNVKFGKQATAEPSAAEDVDVPAAEGKNKAEESTPTPEQREKAYRDFIEAHKDLYTKDTQKIINQRFKETKQLQDSNAKQKAVIDQIAKRYGLDGSDLAALQTALDNDDDYWAKAANDAGFDDVDMFKNFKKLERENAEFRAREDARKKVSQAEEQNRTWRAQAEDVKAKFPKFDIDAETNNPAFMTMLKSGVPMEHAYKVAHFDELVSEERSRTASETEKRVVDNIRAKGARPAENGLSRASGFTVKDDVHKFTRADRAEIARRAARGDYIEF